MRLVSIIPVSENIVYMHLPWDTQMHVCNMAGLCQYDHLFFGFGFAYVVSSYSGVTALGFVLPLQGKRQLATKKVVGKEPNCHR